MVERYFEKLPRITYEGLPAIDITARPRLLSKIQHDPFLFYHYDVRNGERPDQIADRYYNDSYMSWLVYLSNDIRDPYYDWIQNDSEFIEFIRNKYDSIEKAKEKIFYYKSNWKGSDQISVERFNALSVPELKYWDPVYGTRGQIIAYSRKQIDWNLNTNKIVSYSTNSDISSLILDEIVSIKLTSNTSGKGQVLWSNSSVLHLQHLSGTFIESTSVEISIDSVITTSESNLNISVESAELLSESISDSEEVYWNPVYYFDYEYDLMEAKRSIKLLDSKFKIQTAKELRDLFK